MRLVVAGRSDWTVCRPSLCRLGHRCRVSSGADTRTVAVGAFAVLLAVGLGALAASTAGIAAGLTAALAGLVPFAHLTLYMARFKRSEIGYVYDTFTSLRTLLRRQFVVHSGYVVTTGNYYEISYARTPALMTSHEMVKKSLSACRYSSGSPVTENYFGIYSDGQRINAKEWGYDLVGTLYRPHVTLTRFRSAPESEALPRAQSDLSFMATRVGLFEADDSGAARQLVAAVDLVD